MSYVRPAAGQRGHALVGLDAEHRAAGRLELAGLDARAAPDVEHVAPGARRDDPLDERGRVPRPGPVVALGVHAERLGEVPVDVRSWVERRPVSHPPILPRRPGRP